MSKQNGNGKNKRKKLEDALRRAENRGKDYVEWKVNDEDLNFILSEYDTTLVSYEIRIPFHRTKSKSNLVRTLCSMKGHITYRRLTPVQVEECLNAGLTVIPRVYRIRHKAK